MAYDVQQQQQQQQQQQNQPSSPPSLSTPDISSQINARIVDGIREAAAAAAAADGDSDGKACTVEESDYMSSVKLSISGATPVEMKDYAPKVFLRIRSLCNISSDDYRNAWDLSTEKMEMSLGAGRSGSFFMSSNDDTFILKTIPHDEVETLRRLLCDYHNYLNSNRDSLLMRFVGLHRFRYSTMGYLYVVVFLNVAMTPYTTVKYDLKGREPKPGKYLQNIGKTNIVLKDKDLDRKFYVPAEKRIVLLRQFDTDVAFLSDHNMMDYSMLICVETKVCDEASESPDTVTSTAFSYGVDSNPEYNERYYVGIIDCLTNYSTKKVIANACKSVLWPPAQLSTVAAPIYARRIQDYIHQVFDPRSLRTPSQPPLLTLTDSSGIPTSTDGRFSPYQVDDCYKPRSNSTHSNTSAPAASTDSVNDSPLRSPSNSVLNVSNVTELQSTTSTPGTVRRTISSPGHDMRQLSSSSDSVAYEQYHLQAQIIKGVRVACHEADQVLTEFDLSKPEKGPSEVKYTILPQTQGGTVVELKDYCPLIFRYIRKISGITTDEYINSWMLDSDQLDLAPGAGRSGSLFMMSCGKRFMLKTIPHDETETFRRIIIDYMVYLDKNRDSLLMRFLGLHRYKYTRSGQSPGYIYVTVFSNAVRTSEEVIKYDLKGRVPKKGKYLQNLGKTDIVHKDKDLHRQFYLSPENRELFFKTFRSDVDFLASHNMMDYSFFIAVRKLSLSTASSDDCSPLPSNSQPPMQNVESSVSTEAQGMSVFWSTDGGFPSCADEIYYMGIIDCLTEYSAKKVIANACKSLLWTQEQLSTVQSPYYAQRITEYLEEIFHDSALLGPSGKSVVSAVKSVCSEDANLDSVDDGAESSDDVLQCQAQPLQLPDDEGSEQQAQVVEGIRIAAINAAKNFGVTTLTFEEILGKDLALEHFEKTTIKPKRQGGLSIELKDYAPCMFHRVRQLCGIELRDYIKSWTLPPAKLQMQLGAGRSGSLFLFSDDNRFMFKTIPRDEVMTLRRLLPDYLQFLERNKDTLLMRFLGLHRYRYSSTGYLYIIVFMNGVRTTAPVMKFDLKGREPKPGKHLQNRDADAHDTVFKDKDLERHFRFSSAERVKLFEQLRLDIEFLSSHNLMDYSFFIAVAKREPESEECNMQPMHPNAGSRSSTFWSVQGGFPSIADDNEIYHICIIDCLTDYSAKKVIANACKSFMWTQDQLSTVAASFYGDRIFEFLNEFIPDPEKDIPADTSSPPVPKDA